MKALNKFTHKFIFRKIRPNFPGEINFVVNSLQKHSVLLLEF